MPLRYDVRLEPIAPEHAPDVQRLASHPEVAATTNLPDPYPPGAAASWIDWLQPRRERGEEYAFAIRAGRRLVGVCGFVDVDAGKGVGEYGYWIGRPFWGRGYATGAGRHALAFAFEELALARVVARPLVRNAASRRVLEKLGFRCLGTTPNPYEKWDEEDRLVLYEVFPTTVAEGNG